jgi:ketosteroid isomerase-like protein
LRMAAGVYQKVISSGLNLSFYALVHSRRGMSLCKRKDLRQPISRLRYELMRKPGMLIFAACVFVIALLAPCHLAAQAPTEQDLKEQAKENEAKQDELVNIEHETARAIQWNNGALFRRLYGDDFVGILPSGQIKDKAGWIASIEDQNTKYSSFIASDVRVRMFQDTAVVTCLWSARGTRNGQNFSRQLRVIHVYIYGQRGWQAIASQETLLPG